MVKNISGGNKTKKKKRGYSKKEILDEAGKGQMFGQMIENRGGNHFTILCSDNVSRIGRLGGAIRRGARLNPGTYVLVSLREFESDQKNCDIMGVANPPADIRNIFKKINPSKNDDIVEFYDSDNNFDEFEESESTTIQVNVTNLKSTKNNFNNIADIDKDDEDDKDDEYENNNHIKRNTNTNDNITDKNANIKINKNDELIEGIPSINNRTNTLLISKKNDWKKQIEKPNFEPISNDSEDKFEFNFDDI